MRIGPIIVMTAALGTLGALGAAPAREPLAQTQERARERMAAVERRLLDVLGALEAAGLAVPDGAAEAAARRERLRRAVELSREALIVPRMAQARDLLRAGRYGEAAQLQQSLLDDLRRVTAALSAEDWEPELERLRRLERRLEAMLARQTALSRRTAQKAEQPDALAREQSALQDDAAALAGQSPAAPGVPALGVAATSMGAAAGALGVGDAESVRAAMEAQAAAELALRRAIEAVQRAVRRVEGQRLAALRRRLEEMLGRLLGEQRAVRTETAELHAGRDPSGPPSRAERLRTAALGERQAGVGEGAREAAGLVAGEAAMLAFAPALEAVADDAASCAALLGEGVTGEPVPGFQEAIEAALEALLDAARREVPVPVAAPPPPQQPAEEPARRPLLDLLSELKVLRGMQAALKRRTAAVDAWRGTGAAPPQSVAALTERQEEVTGLLADLRDALRPGDLEARGPLEALRGRGAEAQRRLAQMQTGAATRDIQQQVVDGLGAMIAARRPGTVPPGEMPSRPGAAEMQQPGGGTAVPERPAEAAMLPLGEWHEGRLRAGPPAEGDWLPGLPPADREKVADSFATGRLPARYGELLRQYNRRLAEQ